MPLAPGKRLGPYEIVAPLGAGGMGEVYRARDTRLDRTVAVKVLPSHLSSDSGVRARFEREARAVSSLSHPHICTLHDIGSQEGVDYLVMEYLEGETLAARIEKGPVPTEEMLRYAVEIADALEKAHRQGMAHRDLKPGNIMITKGGAKLLDFGLAKAMGMTSAPGTLTASPTMTSPLTAEGTIVGTFQYMSPEQLEGGEADARSDLFAFGAVLYEMATGKKAFTGRTQASLIGSILRDQPPPITLVQPLAPAALDRVVKQCLAKDPDERWQTAGDLKRELIWILESGPSPGAGAAPPPATAMARAAGWLGWSIAALLLITTLALLATRNGGVAEATRPIHANILPEPGTTLVSTSINAGPVAVSPDGTTLVFTARQGEGQRLLWVRRLDEAVTRPLAGSEGATRPFWSPDSRMIGFFANGKLKKVAAAGGPILELADAADPRGGSWTFGGKGTLGDKRSSAGKEGTIIFTPYYTGPLMKVGAEGGAVTAATQLDKVRQESTHRYPCFLPDGRHFLYLSRIATAGAGRKPSIMLGSLDSLESKPLLPVASNVIYASGHLLYVQQKSLMAQPFDLDRLELSGEAFPLVGNVMMDERFSRGVFSVSQNGVLAYQTGSARSLSRLEWRDRSGRVLGQAGDAEAYYDGSSARLSFDAARVLVSQLDPRAGVSAIWLLDIASGVRNRFTLESGDETDGAWSPDGANIVYGTGSGEDAVLVRKSVSGSGVPETILAHAGENLVALDWSADGRYLLYGGNEIGKDSRTSALPMFGPPGDRKPVSVAAASPTRFGARFSPDGRWVAFHLEESGVMEVFVVPFPGPGGRIQVSTQGGSEPSWRRDGRELYYFAPDNRLMAVQVSTQNSTFSMSGVTPLFQASDSGTGYRYDASGDGQRFLVKVAVPDESTSAINLTLNWTDLKQR